jgi:hypothetical protein
LVKKMAKKWRRTWRTQSLFIEGDTPL